MTNNKEIRLNRVGVLRYRRKVLALITGWCLLSFSLFAQKENNYWYFGNEAALNFSSGTPVSLTTSAMLSIEGCASVSDPVTGALLFYTNGLSVWNAANAIMPNGNGLLSGINTSSSQGVLIVSYPKKAGKYVVFTVDETFNNAVQGFRYSVVDMSLDNGLGDIIPSQKNILIQNNVTERLAVAQKADGKGFWIMVHERGTNSFFAYELTENGLNLTPVISSVGSIHTTTMQTNGDEIMGCMKFNPFYNKLALAIYAGNKVELFDFDNCSGVVSNPTSINTLDNPYGIEFSPNSERLYYSLYYNAGFNGVVYQADLTSANIASSVQPIGISSSINYQSVGALQLAPDGKIYVSINSESWLSCIAAPNTLGPACNFIDKAVILQQSGLSPSPGLLGLPQRVIPLATVEDITYTMQAETFCFGETTTLSIENSNGKEIVTWNFGDSGSGQGNTDTGFTATHVFSSTGNFTVQAIIQSGCSLDTVTKVIRIEACGTATPDCTWFIPNAFTPNQDSQNDGFGPLGGCTCADYRFTIFNRWGEAIYTTKNPLEKWNGTFRKQDCEIGSYFYLMQCFDAKGNKKQLAGDVTLLR